MSSSKTLPDDLFRPDAPAFTTEQASRYLCGIYSPAALRKRRQRGLGPPFRRDAAGRVIYLRADLDEHLASLPQG